jgi:hypothetical protein
MFVEQWFRIRVVGWIRETKMGGANGPQVAKGHQPCKVAEGHWLSAGARSLKDTPGAECGDLNK